MKHVEYWLCEKDGQKFSAMGDCMNHEIRLIEKENGIIYYDANGNETKYFDDAWTVVLSNELPEEDYENLKEWFNWTIPNQKGRYTWNENIEDWE